MKRVDIAVDAFTSIDQTFTVIGKGPAYDELVKRAGPSINFLGFVGDGELEQHLASSKAFIFCSYEDFGIAPIEAMATGTPIIAYKAGGALDYVVPGVTGEFFEEQTIESLLGAVTTFNSDKYNSHDIKSAANIYSIEEFQNSMLKIIDKALK